MKTKYSILLVATTLILLGGCSKDDDSSDGDGITPPVTHPTNSIPIANAGEDQDVYTTTVVRFDGNNSVDADNDPLTYHWRIVSIPIDSIAMLLNDTSIYPTLITDKAGTYEVQLIVNDGFADSSPSSMTVTSENDTRYDTVTYDEGIYQWEI